MRDVEQHYTDIFEFGSLFSSQHKFSLANGILEYEKRDLSSGGSNGLVTLLVKQLSHYSTTSITFMNAQLIGLKNEFTGLPVHTTQPPPSKGSKAAQEKNKSAIQAE